MADTCALGTCDMPPDLRTTMVFQSSGGANGPVNCSVERDDDGTYSNLRCIGGTIPVANGGTGTVRTADDVHGNLRIGDAVARAITVGDSTSGGTLSAETPCDGTTGKTTLQPVDAHISHSLTPAPATPLPAPPWRPDYDLIGTLLSVCFGLYVAYRWKKIVEPHPRPPAPPPLPYRGVELD